MTEGLTAAGLPASLARSLPRGYVVASAERSTVGSTPEGVTLHLRQIDTDAAGEPLTLHVEHDTGMPRPWSSEQGSITFAGLEGRWTPSRSQLEWVDRGVYHPPGSDGSPIVDRDRRRDRRGEDGSRVRRSLRYGAGGLTGVALGIVLTLAIQAASLPSTPEAPTGPSLLLTRPAPPETFLAWVPRGLPDTFAARVARQPEIGRLTVVAEDNVWLARSWSAAGELVDRPVRPYRIPLDVAAVDPETFAPFLPGGPGDARGDRGRQGILGSTSASVRRLGPGGLLELGRGSSGSPRSGRTSWSVLRSSSCRRRRGGGSASHASGTCWSVRPWAVRSHPVRSGAPSSRSFLRTSASSAASRCVRRERPRTSARAMRCSPRPAEGALR